MKTSLLLLLAACGGSPHAVEPAAPSSPPQVAAPAPTAKTEAVPVAPSPTKPPATTAKTEPVLERWVGFPGPMVKPPVTSGVALVVAPIQAHDWTRGLHIYYANVLRVEGTELVVEGVHNEVYVPGAFVAPPEVAKPLKVGSLVQFQQNPGLTLGVHIGRIASVAKTEQGPSYDIRNKFVDTVDDTVVAAARVVPLDGTLRLGAPVTFDIDQQHAMGVYIGPGHDADHAWVLSVGHAMEKTGVKPLVLRSFAKGAKVAAVFETTSILQTAHGSMEPRQLLAPGTITAVLDGGFGYKVRRDDGSSKGEIVNLDLDEVFAR